MSDERVEEIRRQSECIHGALETYPGTSAVTKGKARCHNCGVWLVAANEREQRTVGGITFTVGDDKALDALLAALARAERSVAEFKTTNRLLMGERDAARAEVERLKAAVGEDRGPGCISGCSWGTDDQFHHHPYCQTFGGEKPLMMGGRTWIAEGQHNMDVVRLEADLARVRAALEAAAQTFRNLRDSGLDEAGCKLSCTYAANLIDAALEGR